MDNAGTMTISGALKQMSIEPRMGAWECNVCVEAAKCIEQLEAELVAYRTFAERAKRDYTECDKMFIHISALEGALKNG